MNDSDPPPASPVIQRRNLGDDVYQILWSRIVSRDLHPGDKLSDLRLSTELGVSRTPVREALHRLLQDGVIRAEPNRGFFVTSFSGRDIEEIFEIRAALEALALRYLARARTTTSPACKLDEIEREIARRNRRANPRRRAVSQPTRAFTGRSSASRQRAPAGNDQRHLGTIAVFQKAGTHVPGYIEVAIQQHEIIGLLRDPARRGDRCPQAHIRDETRIIADLAETTVILRTPTCLIVTVGASHDRAARAAVGSLTPAETAKLFWLGPLLVHRRRVVD